MSSMKFTSLRIEGWRQFGHVDISLHPRLTVLTGANGAGKSSLLKIFQRHFGIEQPFLATPFLQSGGGYYYLTGLFSDTIAKVWEQVLEQAFRHVELRSYWLRQWRRVGAPDTNKILSCVQYRRYQSSNLFGASI